jgi:glycosyltransferase involved in cell wall biosynthesis
MVRKALELPLVRRAYLLPGSASSELPRDERLRFAAPFFDTTLFRPAQDKDPRLVLRASVCQPQNAVAFMLELAKRLPEHRVVVALAHSTGMVEYVEAIQALKAEMGSPAELIIDVQRPEMAALFAKAGIYIHTATTPDQAVHKLIGGPVSVPEAMATGAYVLARNAPSLVQLIGDAGATYRDVDDAAALIRATESWSEAQWREAQRRSVERAYKFHADELVLRPLFEDWCALVKERARPAMNVADDGRHAGARD